MGCGSSANSILEPKGKKIIMLGAGGSGKTSLLYMITKKMQVPAIPTIGHNAEFLAINKEKFVLYDIGARNQDFTHLLDSSVAIVYVIDAANPNAQQLKDSMDLFLASIKNPYLQGMPIAICLNKQDLTESIYIDEEVVEQKLQLSKIAGLTYKVFKISYKTQLNLLEPFTWLQSLKLKSNAFKKQPSEVNNKKFNSSSTQLPGSGTEHLHSNNIIR